MCAVNSQVGRRVKLVSSSRPNIPVKPEDTGVIWRVTQIGTVRVLWDNGCRLDLDPKTDQWEVPVNGTNTDDG